MIGIVGASGFVGSNLKRIFPESVVLSRSDLNEGCTTTFSTVFIAAPAADKWRINQDPLTDQENIQALVRGLIRLRTHRFVLFSTIDVYSSHNESNEESKCLDSMSYGGNRYFLESLLGDSTEHLLIRRLGGLFGPGLKKNLIYDALNNRFEQLRKYHPESTYQYMSVENSINLSVSDSLADFKIVNIVGEPVAAKRLLAGRENYLSFDAERVSYNVKSNHGFNGPYFLSAESVLESVNEYYETQL
jgi:nucleoside-diphosphate-sugar epimerase